MKLDLNKGINIQIGGEVGRYHTIPIDVLVKVSQNLQKLVLDIAQNEIKTPYNIDLNNFKIELSGLGEGSVVPMFVFTPRVKFTMAGEDDGVPEQRKFVNNRFSLLMNIASKGDFQLLKKEYTDNKIRNTIINDLHDFTNSSGDSPMAFARITKTGKYRILGTIHRVKTKTLKELIVKIDDKTEVDEEYGVGTIRYRTTKGGGKSRHIVTDIKDHDAALSYSTKEIQFMGRVYELKATLNCRLEKEDGYFVIENNLLDIVGTGETIEDAKVNFAEEFDYIYKRYNELSEDELTSKVRTARDFLNLIVIKKTK